MSERHLATAGALLLRSGSPMLQNNNKFQKQVSFSVSDISYGRERFQVGQSFLIKKKVDRAMISLKLEQLSRKSLKNQVVIEKVLQVGSTQAFFEKHPVIGNGTLVQGSLMITTHQTLPRPLEYAFSTIEGRIRIRPEVFFITDRILNITVVQVQTESEGLYVGYPFSLKKGDEVRMVDQEPLLNLYIVEITSKYICFTAGLEQPVFQGAPVFSSSGELVGIYTHSILHLCYACRLEPILAFLRNQPDSQNLRALVEEYVQYECKQPLDFKYPYQHILRNLSEENKEKLMDVLLS